MDSNYSPAPWSTIQSKEVSLRSTLVPNTSGALDVPTTPTPEKTAIQPRSTLVLSRIFGNEDALESAYGPFPPSHEIVAVSH